VDERLPNEIKVESTFKFETMGRNFLGKVLSIKSKTAQIVSLLMSWGYQLESSETLTLLWPPAVFLGDSALIDADFAYLYSTFDLHAHGTKMSIPEDINKNATISKVSVNARTKILQEVKRRLVLTNMRRFLIIRVILVTREVSNALCVR
jgi:hypothetical protein